VSVALPLITTLQWLSFKLNLVERTVYGGHFVVFSPGVHIQWPVWLACELVALD
jgi:hypothetical protein